VTGPWVSDCELIVFNFTGRLYRNWQISFVLVTWRLGDERYADRSREDEQYVQYVLVFVPMMKRKKLCRTRKGEPS
jgi:hypothetical protein